MFHWEFLNQVRDRVYAFSPEELAVVNKKVLSFLDSELSCVRKTKWTMPNDPNEIASRVVNAQAELQLKTFAMLEKLAAKMSNTTHTKKKKKSVPKFCEAKQ